MTTTPTRPDPAADKQRALRQAARMVQKWRDAEQAAVTAMAFAHRHAGASLRELESATGVNYRTAGRLIDRLEDETGEQQADPATASE